METLEGLKKEVERLTLKMGQLEESHDKELLETEHRYSLEIERLTLERNEWRREALKHIDWLHAEQDETNRLKAELADSKRWRGLAENTCVELRAELAQCRIDYSKLNADNVDTHQRMHAELAEANRKIECFEEALDGTVDGWRESPLAKNLAKRQGESTINYGATDKLEPDEFAPENVIEPAKCDKCEKCGTYTYHNNGVCPHCPAPADAVREWWIIINGDSAFVMTEKSGHGALDGLATHVIEKRAYDALKAENAELAKQHNDVVEELARFSRVGNARMERQYKKLLALSAQAEALAGALKWCHGNYGSKMAEQFVAAYETFKKGQGK